MEILIGIALILFGLKLIMKGEDGDSFWVSFFFAIETYPFMKRNR